MLRCALTFKRCQYCCSDSQSWKSCSFKWAGPISQKRKHASNTWHKSGCCVVSWVFKLILEFIAKLKILTNIPEFQRQFSSKLGFDLCETVGRAEFWVRIYEHTYTAA